MDGLIVGATASEIADSVRDLRERGALRAGEALPPVRTLADRLGVNRNTVVAAYRHLAQAGLVTALGRGGTRIADPTPVAQEGFAPGSVLRDVGSGNPDAALIPDPASALAAAVGRPVLYGEPVIDAALEAWARPWMTADLDPADVRLTVTSGAVDAVERLLAQGARAVVCTPRAQNPTGASLTAERAAALRAVLADHPYVLVIEDDHFSLLSERPFHGIVGPEHRRFALVRSVSKFLGPDMCVAVTASDPETAARLAQRLSPGTTWVSHLLQRLAHALLADPGVVAQLREAAAHYAGRNAAFAERLAAHGLRAIPGDGLNLWLELAAPARAVSEQLMRRGWLARTGDEFVLDGSPSRHLRLTVHELDDADAEQLATDLAAAVRAAATANGRMDR